jgi:hypothetical protein
MTRQFDIREPSIEALSVAPIYFRYGSNKNKVLVDMSTANAMLAVYKALSPEMQAKFARMLNKPATLTRLVDFCWSKVSF